MAKKLYKIDSDLDLTAKQLSADQRGEQRATANHKIIWPFIILSAVIIYFAANFLYKNLTNPLTYNVPEWIQEQLNPVDETEALLALKEKDTDQDGLNDYQEIYQFYTSIFLEDTDSDGYSDFEEATSGNDPLCPTGEACNLLRLITPNTKLADIVQEIALNPDLTVQGAALAEFRKFLLANGLPQEELDALSDDDLLVIFSAIEESQIIPSEELDSEATPEEVRLFLLNQPDVNAEEVNALSDEELIAIRGNLIGK